MGDRADDEPTLGAAWATLGARLGLVVEELGERSVRVGSFLHRYQGSPQPWPGRAVAGPPWWIDPPRDMADTLDQ